MAKGDQVPMFPPEPGELRLCLGCRTKYESVPELHNGGWCPTCGSTHYEPAVPSDYRAKPSGLQTQGGKTTLRQKGLSGEEADDVMTGKKPETGSTEDYLNE